MFSPSSNFAPCSLLAHSQDEAINLRVSDRNCALQQTLKLKTCNQTLSKQCCKCDLFLRADFRPPDVQLKAHCSAGSHEPIARSRRIRLETLTASAATPDDAVDVASRRVAPRRGASAWALPPVGNGSPQV